MGYGLVALICEFIEEDFLMVLGSEQTMTKPDHWALHNGIFGTLFEQWLHSEIPFLHIQEIGIVIRLHKAPQA